MTCFCLFSSPVSTKKTVSQRNTFGKSTVKFNLVSFEEIKMHDCTARMITTIENREFNVTFILGIKQQEEEQKFKHDWPPCNMEYKADTGITRFWCTDVSFFIYFLKLLLVLTLNLQQSGGVKRDWAGYPIQLFNQDSKTFTCVCAKKENFELPQLRPYDTCDDAKRSCTVQSEEQINED